MRILVFGAGAVGQTVGCMLAADDHSVDLILREQFIEKIKSDGLKVSSIFGDYFTVGSSLGLYPAVDDIRVKTFDFVLVTTKSHDTKNAAAELLNIQDQSFIAVSMQNGCGNFETLIENFGEGRSLGARLITGFEIERPGKVKLL